MLDKKKAKLCPPPKLVAVAVLAALGLTSQTSIAAQNPQDEVKLTKWTAVKIYDGANQDFDILANQKLLTGESGNLNPLISINQSFTQDDLNEIQKQPGYEDFASLFGDDVDQDVSFVAGVYMTGKQDLITSENASVNVSVDNLQGSPYIELVGFNHADGSIKFTGSETTISATSAMVADSGRESAIYGYLLENPIDDADQNRKVTFSADKTLISASTTNENGVDVLGFHMSADAVDNPEVVFENGDATITTDSVAKNGMSYALFMHFSDTDNTGPQGKVTVNEGASLSINAKGYDAVGIFADNGTFNSNGELVVTAQGLGDKRTSAIYATGNAQLNFTGETTITATSESGKAYALYVEHTLSAPSGQQTSNDGDPYPTTDNFGVNFSASSQSTLNGNVFVDESMDITVDGDMTINGGVELLGSIHGTGNIRINGQDQEIVFNTTDTSNSALAINKLTISDATVTNNTKVDIAESLTFSNVTITNSTSGDIEVEGTTTLGSGTTLIDHGHFGSNDWVIETGAKFLSDLNGDVFDENGNALLESGRFELAGGLVGAIDDEDYMTGIIIRPADDTTSSVPAQFVVSNGDYSWKNIIVEREADASTLALEISGGNVSTENFDANLGNAAIKSGTLHADQLNANGNFTMTVEGGTLSVDKFIGAQNGEFTLTAGIMQASELDLNNGLLTIAENAELWTYSNQIFNPGLNEDGSNAEAGSLIYGEEHLSFADGSSLTILDERYNYDYRDSARELLEGVDITFKGQIVDSSGEILEEIGFDEIEEGDTLTQTDIKAPTPSDGTDTVTVDKSVGGKTFVVTEGTKVAVSENKTLTLVGSNEGGELVDFQATEGTETSVSVSGGLALGSNSASTTKGTISSTVNLENGANLNATNGEFKLSSVNADSAEIEVASGKLAVETLKLTGETTLASAAGAVTEVTNVTTEEGRHQLKGEITASTVAGSGTLLVGSAQEETSASSTLNVNKLTHTGVIFIDPAWTDGATMNDGSFLTVQQLDENGNLNAHVVAGQHSTFVFGGTKDEAVQAFAKTGLTYGKDDVSAVLYVAKAINVSNGSITVDGSMSELGSFSGTEGSLTVAANGLAMIDAKALTNGAAITASTVTFKKGSHIRVVNLTKTSEGTLIKAEENNLTIAEDVIEDAKSTSAIVSLDLTKNDDGTLSYSTTLNRAADVFAGFEGASLMDAMHEASMNDVNAEDRATRFLSRMAAFGDYGVGSVKEATAIGNQAMALAATSGVYNAALDASKLMNRSLDRRMTMTGSIERKAGMNLWADVLGGTSGADKLYGDSGYDMDLYGAVLGADIVVPCGAVLGAAITVGKGDGNSEEAAMNVDNDVDFVGFSLYSNRRAGNFNTKVDLGYIHTKSDLTASAFDMDIGEEIKADAWTFGLGAEYIYQAGSFDVVPHIGVRWTRLDVDSYTGALKTDSDTMNIYTMPIGVGFSGHVSMGSWQLAPMADISVVPSFGDDNATSKVRWGSVSESIKTHVVDDAPVQMSLGVNAQNGNWTLGASYDLDVGGDERLNNTFTVRARYAF